MLLRIFLIVFAALVVSACEPLLRDERVMTPQVENPPARPAPAPPAPAPTGQNNPDEFCLLADSALRVIQERALEYVLQ